MHRYSPNPRLLAFVAIPLLVGVVALAKAVSLQNNAPVARVDWGAAVEKGAYPTYEHLRKALVDETITSDSLVAFAEIITELPRLRRIEDLLIQLDRGDRKTVIDALYRELMLSNGNPDVLYGYLKQHIERKLAHADKLDTARAPTYAWDLSYSTNACLLAFEATKQHRFLVLSASTFERFLAFRDSELGRVDGVRGRVLHSWGSDTHLPGSYTSMVTIAGRITYPIARFCWIVKNDNDLAARFGEQADRFLKAVELCIGEYDAEFRMLEGTDQGYYLRPSNGSIEALNHQACAGNTLVMLHVITGKEKYHRMASAIASYYKASFYSEENGTVVWGFDPTPDNRRGNRIAPIWKAQVTVRFALLAAQHGIVFTDDDLRGIARMFLTNIYRGPGQFNAIIGSTNRPMEKYRNHHGGYLSLLPYMLLDEYAPEIRQVLEDLVATRPDMGGWFTRSKGAIAYAHRLRASEAAD